LVKWLKTFFEWWKYKRKVPWRSRKKFMGETEKRSHLIADLRWLLDG
jgi:hypothetical protein